MTKTLSIPEQKTPHFTMKKISVTVNRDLKLLKETLSKSDIERFLTLHQLAQDSPKKALKEVESLLAAYPHHPEILNLLTYLWIAKRKMRRAHKLIEENYTQNPDYLLGKINYADYCIRKGKLDEVPKIFGQKFDLRHIDPSRTMFHLSEYRGFMVMMGFYHLAQKKREAAEEFFYLAHTVDSSHPSAQLLKKKLYKKPFYKKMLRIDR
ncbi:tetratricopeptide repeat protein [Simkania sp.]|uniref:tetratricopeptide repeat protein n=1 Tax=Simkania sp. TaxID=34094 RepID=UPI003B52CDE3